jgi:hypothetical protein
VSWGWGIQQQGQRGQDREAQGKAAQGSAGQRSAGPGQGKGRVHSKACVGNCVPAATSLMTCLDELLIAGGWCASGCCWRAGVLGHIAAGPESVRQRKAGLHSAARQEDAHMLTSTAHQRAAQLCVSRAHSKACVGYCAPAATSLMTCLDELLIAGGWRPDGCCWGSCGHTFQGLEGGGSHSWAAAAAASLDAAEGWHLTGSGGKGQSNLGSCSSHWVLQGADCQQATIVHRQLHRQPHCDLIFGTTLPSMHGSLRPRHALLCSTLLCR